VEAWIEAGAIRPLPVGNGLTWLTRTEAVRAGSALLDGTIGASMPAAHRNQEELFGSRSSSATRSFRAPLALSSGLHVGILAALIVVTTLGLGATTATESAVDPQPLRLVYLTLPGPGGGGGGGGLKQIVKPPKAQRKGTAHIDSPLPRREPPPAVDPPPKPEPPKVDPEPLPPVQAPVVEAPADEKDRPGVIEQSPTTTESRGPGDGGGVGTGSGTGIGEGQGTGIGEGEGGGTGGGPYRPGSGVTPPTLLHEVKPDYTEEARRGGVRGDVVVEIVVRRDGTVGNVKVLQGLGHGLDERAVTAVKLWKFSPATRKGTPVDVIVEVAMEFRLR
jgi:TonB family protein